MPGRLLALLALPVALLAACGGGQSPERALQETFDGTRPVHSGRLEFSLRVDAEGPSTLPGPVALRLRGPFVTRGVRPPRFDLAARLATGGRNLQFGAVSVGDRGFVTFGGRAYRLDRRTFARFRRAFERARPAGHRGPGGRLAEAGVDPRRWLREVEDRGTEQFDATTVRHLSGPVDVRRLLADLDRLLARAGELGATRPGRRLGPLERRVIEEAVDRAQVYVWTGDRDRILHRLAPEVSFEVPAEERAAAHGLRRGTLRLDVGYRDVNEPQTIRAPRRARPLAELPRAIATSSPAGRSGRERGFDTSTPPAGRAIR